MLQYDAIEAPGQMAHVGQFELHVLPTGDPLDGLDVRVRASTLGGLERQPQRLGLALGDVQDDRDSVQVRGGQHH